MGEGRINQQLSRVVRTLEELREALFETSRESVKGDDPDWSKAEALFSLAKSVDSLRQRTVTLRNGAPQPNAPLQSVPVPRVAKSLKFERKNKQDYPRYEVRGRSLIKTGLSRDEKAEYEHVMPRAEFEKVFARIATLASSRKEFTADDVQEGLTCPAYQMYMVLALLREMRLLDTPRRGSYQVHANSNFPTDSNLVWHKIGQNKE